MQAQPLKIKLVVVGDGAVGKTSMLYSFTKNYFPTEYEPTVFGNLTATLKVDGQLIHLGLWDTAGQQQFSSLRHLAYPSADLFFIVFSVDSPDSFLNARKKWYPELMQCVPNTTVIFVGNKIDLRDEKSSPKTFIHQETGRKFIENELKCRYFQCSALTQQGLKQLFEQGAKIIINKKLGGNIKTEKLGKKEGSKGGQKDEQKGGICQLV